MTAAACRRLAAAAAVGLCGLVGHPGAWAQVAEPAPVADYLRPAAFSEPRLSPDGARLAVSVPVGGRMNLAVVDLATREAKAVTAVREFDVLDSHWATDEKLVFSLGQADSPTGPGQYRGGGLYVVSRDGRQSTQLAPSRHTGGRGLSFYRRIPGRIDEAMVAGHLRNAEALDLYRIDLTSGALTLVTVDRPDRTTGFVSDRDLVPRIATAWIPGSNIEIVWHRASAAAPWSELLRIVGIEVEAEVPQFVWLDEREARTQAANFRITPGLGGRIQSAGWGTLGRQMSDDHEDAARWAIAEGFADPKRICISGASYGGYATLMALARAPELWRCGVAGLVVADLEMQFSSTAGGLAWSPVGQSVWRRIVGMQAHDAALLRDLSPAHKADRIRAGLFLYAGSGDIVTPIEQTNTMVRALERAGRPPREVMIRAEEGHGFGKLEHRVELYERILRFIEQEVGPSAPAR